MIIRDLNKYAPAVEKYYPYYGNILDMQHFESQNNGYFVISTKAGKYQHLRIVRDNISPKIIHPLNLRDIKSIMTFQWGINSIGLYVLPKKADVICGMPTEHIFSYNGIQNDFKSIFYKTSKFDTVVKSVIKENEKLGKVIESFKVMKIPQKTGFIYCNYTTEQEACFNFFSLQVAKDEYMNMSVTPMVVPINSGSKDNFNLKILPWAENNIPNLHNLYDYRKQLENPPIIQNIISGLSR